MNWKPLFSSESERSRIHHLLISLGDTLHLNPIEADGLLTGKAGVSLFYAYLYKYCGDLKYRKAYEKIMDDCLVSIPNSNLNGSFCGGISGICWVLNHLSTGSFIDTKVEDIIGHEVHEFLRKYSEVCLKLGNFDVLHGGLGPPLYMSSLNKKSSSIRTNINDTLNNLEECSVIINGRHLWSNSFLGDPTKYDLCLAHGLSSIIIFLCKSLVYTDSRPLAILENCVNLLLDIRSPSESPSLFPYYFSDEIQKDTTRLAWCYGDLGIGHAIWYAGNVCNNMHWQREAIEILTHASKRQQAEECKIVDPGFCHGSIGVGHFFNRYYQKTGLKCFEQASTHWYLYSLDLIDVAADLPRIKKFSTENRALSSWDCDYSLLEGVTGVGLSLISAISHDEPKWDSCLLLS